MIYTSLADLPKNSTSLHIYTQELKKNLSQYSDIIKIFANASKNECNVRNSIIYYNDEEVTLTLSIECSIYTVEAIAIWKALEYSLEKQNNNFVILSDSLSSITSIANTHKPNDISKEIHLDISAHHTKGNVVKLMCIPGHSSINGNKRADLLAKNTASTVPTSNMANISAQDA